MLPSLLPFQSMYVLGRHLLNQHSLLLPPESPPCSTLLYNSSGVSRASSPLLRSPRFSPSPPVLDSGPPHDATLLVSALAAVDAGCSLASSPLSRLSTHFNYYVGFEALSPLHPFLYFPVPIPTPVFVPVPAIVVVPVPAPVLVSVTVFSLPFPVPGSLHCTTSSDAVARSCARSYWLPVGATSCLQR